MTEKKTRKPNLRSSIYEGQDRRWHGRVTMGVKDDGSPDRRHVTGRTEATVTAKVRKLEKERDAGLVRDTGRPPTVAEWMRTWLATIVPRRASQASIDSTYRPKVERWIIPKIGKHRLDRLRPTHLDAFYMWLAEQGLSEKSANMIHLLISRALKTAVRRGLVARNVAQLVDPPQYREVEIEPLTEEEARAILNVVKGRRNAARWSAAFALGLRQSEALGMRWRYLDLDRRVLRVFQLKRSRFQHGCADPHACQPRRHCKPCSENCDQHGGRCPRPCAPGCTAHARYCPDRRGGEWEFRPPKGGEGRTVAIPAQLVKQLRAHRVAQAEERLAAGELWEEGWDLVFARPDGRPIDPSDDWKEWKAILREAGIRDARPHDARHTSATLLLEQGVDIRVVQAVLGHSSLTVTRRYTHVRSKLAEDAAARMDRVLWGSETRSETRKDAK